MLEMGFQGQGSGQLACDIPILREGACQGNPEDCNGELGGDSFFLSIIQIVTTMLKRVLSVSFVLLS